MENQKRQAKIYEFWEISEEQKNRLQEKEIFGKTKEFVTLLIDPSKF